MTTSGTTHGGSTAGGYRAVFERLSLNVAAQTFYRNLTTKVARLTHARRVVFLELSDGYLSGVRDAFGFPGSELANLALACASADRRGDVELAVYEGQALNLRLPESSGSSRALMDALSATDVAAVGWRQGDRPLGILAACNSSGGRGFTDGDLSVLDAAGMGAAMAWEHHRALDSLNGERAELEMRVASQARVQRENDVRLDLLSLVTSEMRAAVRSAAAPEPLNLLPSRLDDIDAVLADLREPGRARGSSLRLAHERLNLAGVVSEVCMALRRLPPGHCDLVNDVGSRASIWGDRRALTSILVTLISAAMRNAPPGATVQVKDRVGRGQVHLGIRATEGSFMNVIPEFLDDALARCRLLARMHGGDLVTDAIDNADFPWVLSLPLAGSDRQDPPRSPAEVLEIRGSGGICVHEDLMAVEREGRMIRLSWREWRLFAFMWKHPNTVFTRAELAVGAWNDSSRSRTELVDINISRIRIKVERDAKRPNLICTVRGRGYELRIRSAG